MICCLKCQAAYPDQSFYQLPFLSVNAEKALESRECLCGNAIHIPMRMIPSSCKACGVHLPDDKIREIVTMYSLTFNSDREVVEEVYRRVFGAPMVPGKPVGFLCSSCGVQSLLDAVEDGYPPAQKFMKRLETSIRQDRLGLRLIKGEKR